MDLSTLLPVLGALGTLVGGAVLLFARKDSLEVGTAREVVGLVRDELEELRREVVDCQSQIASLEGALGREKARVIRLSNALRQLDQDVDKILEGL